MKRRIERIAGLSPERKALFLLKRRQQKQIIETERSSYIGAHPPASPDQTALWFFHQLDPKTSAYNVVSACLLEGIPDIELFQKSYRLLTERHKSLKTAFFQRDGALYQNIRDTIEHPLYMVDCSLNRQTQNAVVREITRIVQHPFNLERGPLIRLAMIRRSCSEHILAAVMHHAITDWLSFRILFRDLFNLYGSAFKGRYQPLPFLPLQYADYALERHRWLLSEECGRQRRFWLDRLKDAPLILQLPKDKPRPARPSYRGERLFFDLSPRLTGSIRSWNRQAKASSLMTVLTSVFGFLHRYTGAEDMLIGTGAANRDDPNTKNMIGYLLNLVIIRGNLHGDPDFATLLARIKTEVLAAQRNRHFPFRVLVEAVNPPRDPSRNPVYQVEFNHVTVEDKVRRPDTSNDTAPGECPGLVQKPFLVDRGSATADLQISFVEYTGHFQIWLEYAVDLFERETVLEMGGLLINLLEDWTDHPKTPISRVRWTTPEQRRRLLRIEPELVTITHPLHQRFESRVSEHPDRSAVVMPFPDQKPVPARIVTYASLDQTAVELMRILQDHGIGPDQTVAVCARRSPQLIAALFAILKAGGCFLPLDPNLPGARLDFMIRDGNARLILADKTGRAKLSGVNRPVLDLDIPIHKKNGSAPSPVIFAENAAYLIYTSGSTGRPKGVLIPHAGADNFLSWLIRTLEPTHLAWSLAAGTISFDLSFIEIFTPLSTGGCLILVDSPFRIPELPDIWQPRFVMTTPSAMEALGHRDPPRKAATIVLGGEALPSTLLNQLFDMDWVENRYNFYGPTEVSVCTLATRLTPEMIEAPLGYPAAGALVYLLNRHLEPVPTGVRGEIYLSGPGLARGYYRGPDLTADRFLPDPFGRKPGGRMYRTGDAARRNRRGAFFFLGRLDDQVKIRGYRIEIGEIENALRAHTAVKDVAVVVTDEPTGRLAAHFVPEKTMEEPIRRLRRFCESSLPPYMVPALWFTHDSIPLQTNGKADRESLIRFSANVQQEPKREIHPPRNENERILVDAWRAVLKLEKVGIHDNFFALGGDSILALLMVSEVRGRGISLSPTLLFHKQTVAELARAVVRPSDAPDSGPTRSRNSGPAPLSPIQHWFFERFGVEYGALAFGFMLAVNEKPVCKSLEKAFQLLAIHHPTLCSVFRQDRGNWRQHPGEGSVPEMIYLDFSGLEGSGLSTAIKFVADRARTLLDPSAGRLAIMVLMALPGQTYRCLPLFDHLVMDVVSWRLVIPELIVNYRNLVAGLAPVPHCEKVTVSEWCERLKQRLPEIAEEHELWSRIIQDQETSLPVDFPKGFANNKVSRIESVTCYIENERDMTRFYSGLEKNRLTPEELLLSALAKVLSEWGGRSRVDLHLEGHGRRDPFASSDLTQTIGWLTTLYPLALEIEPGRLSGNGGIALLKHVKERMAAIPNHGLGHGVLRYLVEPERRIPKSRAPVSFNYLGRFLDEPRAMLTPVSDDEPRLQDGRWARAHQLEITAAMTERGILVRWFYANSLHQRASIERLADRFKQVLADLVSIAAEWDPELLTPTDFPELDLTAEELAAVIEDIQD